MSLSNRNTPLPPIRSIGDEEDHAADSDSSQDELDDALLHEFFSNNLSDWTDSDSTEDDSDDEKNLVTDDTNAKIEVTNSGQHVYLSYQLDAKNIVLRFREQLNKAGIKSWIDEVDMTGSDLDAMATAVQNASVVIMFLSQKYKDSYYCKKEAEYISRFQKPIIPLRLQEGYNPDGWLGNLVGSKFVYDVRIPDKYKDSLRNLIEDIENFNTHGETKIDKTNSGEHVFISYQYDDKDIVLKVRDRLKKEGIKTWIDEDDMTGSDLESMATAVENASVVIICLSQKYKDSPSCKTEAEYIDRIRKPIIPLRLQAEYYPDGWLGNLVGSKHVYDVSIQNMYEDSVGNLLKELEHFNRHGEFLYKTDE